MATARPGDPPRPPLPPTANIELAGSRLVDNFALAAMQGILMSSRAWTPESVARDAVACAEALLLELIERGYRDVT